MADAGQKFHRKQFAESRSDLCDLPSWIYGKFDLDDAFNMSRLLKSTTELKPRKSCSSEEMVVAEMLQALAMQGAAAPANMPNIIDNGEMGLGAHGRALVGQFDGARRHSSNAGRGCVLFKALGRGVFRISRRLLPGFFQ